MSSSPSLNEPQPKKLPPWPVLVLLFLPCAIIMLQPLVVCILVRMHYRKHPQAKKAVHAARSSDGRSKDKTDHNNKKKKKKATRSRRKK